MIMKDSPKNLSKKDYFRKRNLLKKQFLQKMTIFFMNKMMKNLIISNNIILKKTIEQTNLILHLFEHLHLKYRKTDLELSNKLLKLKKNQQQSQYLLQPQKSLVIIKKLTKVHQNLKHNRIWKIATYLAI